MVGSYEQAWALLGVAAEVRELDWILALVAAESVLRDWVAANSVKAPQVGPEWGGVLRAHRWLVAARRSGRNLREVGAAQG